MVIEICQPEVSTLPPAPPPAPQVQQATYIVVDKGDNISFNGDESDSNRDDSEDDIDDDDDDDDEFDYGIDSNDLLAINIDATVAQNHLHSLYLQQNHERLVSDIHSYLSSLMYLAWCQVVFTDLLMCRKEKFTRENHEITRSTWSNW